VTHTMTLSTILEDLVGQRCVGADNPHGSILRLDIGPLGPPPDDPSGRQHGWRHLTVLSPWRITAKGRVIADWNTPGGVHGEIVEAATSLIGHSVVNAKCEGPGYDLDISFSDGFRLFVFSDTDDGREDAWFILGTDGLELSVRPAYDEEPGWKIKASGA
jgi:hypothetical protein